MKPVKLINLLLSLVVMVTMLSSSAQAALKAFGPVDPVSTLPSYYLDPTDLALQPCLDQNGMCLLPPPFDTGAVHHNHSRIDQRQQLSG